MLSSFLLLFLFFMNSAEGATYYAEMHNEYFKVFKFDNGTLKEEKDKKLLSPIGSIWKLFTYAYIKDSDAAVPPYTCRGVLKEELFCCRKGETINIETALKRSCGLFFDKKRINISEKKWSQYWKDEGISFRWLREYQKLNPAQLVPVSQLLEVMDALRKKPSVDFAIRKVIVSGTGVQGLDYLGSFPRIKTFTWDHPEDTEKFIGGGAGWLPNNTLIWFSGEGKSHEVITHLAPYLEKRWNFKGVYETECVSVRFFRDYPISKVKRNGKVVKTGLLVGENEIHFKNGNKLSIRGNDSLTLSRWKGNWVITGEMSLTEYIARVIDREFVAKETRASEAMSIVARTYLFQNAEKVGSCYRAPDSSSFQRVSASVPSESSLRIASKTADLILSQKNVRYHLSKSSPGMISWKGAVKLQNENMLFSEILKTYFPSSTLTLYTNKLSSECNLLKSAYQWLKLQERDWKRALSSRPGFEYPGKVKVCKSMIGSPYANLNSNEIYVEKFSETEDLISVTHEWLHLAFKNFPLKNRERDLDEIARRLITKGSL